jgi:hypothetical protein
MPNRLCLWLVVVTLLASAASAAQPRAPRIDITCDQKDPVKREACVANVREADIPVEDRIVVEFKPGDEPRPRVAFGQRKAEAFSALTGVRMEASMFSGHDDKIDFRLNRPITLKRLDELLAQLRGDPDVISARAVGPPFAAPYPPQPGEHTKEAACQQDEPGSGAAARSCGCTSMGRSSRRS